MAINEVVPPPTPLLPLLHHLTFLNEVKILGTCSPGGRERGGAGGWKRYQSVLQPVLAEISLKSKRLNINIYRQKSVVLCSLI